MKKTIDNYISKLIEKQPSVLTERLLFSTFPGRRNRSILLMKLANDKSNFSSMLHCATAVELAHRSSIIIDDLLDDDSQRRGFAAFHVKYGLENTILISNLLNSMAYSELVKYEKVSKVSLFDEFTSCYNQMVIGELGDINLMPIDNNTDFFKFYKETVLGKTNPPFVFLLSVIAKSRFYNSHTVELYRNIGRKIGNLYQMYNDLYDELYSDPMERGEKTTIQSTLTFVKSYALSENILSSEVKDKIIQSIGKSITSDEFFQIKKYLGSEKNIQYYNDFLNKKTSTLIKELSSLEDNDYNILKIFIEKFTSSSSWNHHEFGSAGY